MAAFSSDSCEIKRSLQPLCGIVALATTLLLGSSSCAKHAPTQPAVNHRPTILSVEVIPHPIGFSDTALVICHAVDPDGDALQYDWITQLPLKIAGAQGGCYQFATHSDTCIVYYAVPASLITAVPMQVIVKLLTSATVAK